MHWNEFLYKIGALKERIGGTRKVGDLPVHMTCRHPDHNPAGMVVREPGYYEHVCPGCGNEQSFTVFARASLVQK